MILIRASSGPVKLGKGNTRLLASCLILEFDMVNLVIDNYYFDSKLSDAKVDRNDITAFFSLEKNRL